MTRPRRGEKRRNKHGATWWSSQKKTGSGRGRRRTKHSARTYKRQSRRWKRSANHWFQHDDLTFSKILIRDVELLWLSLEAPQATISFERVKDCESYPSYKSGKWDGNAHFVRFPEGDKHNAILFRIEWWNQEV